MAISQEQLKQMQERVRLGKEHKLGTIGQGACATYTEIVDAPVVLAQPTKPLLNLNPLAKTTDEAKLNKTERAFLNYLRSLHYPRIGIQNVTLKLADDTRYTPDFNVTDQNGQWVLYEVKGFMRDDALVKLKVAARMFPELTFVLVFKKGTGWDERIIKP